MAATLVLSAATFPAFAAAYALLAWYAQYEYLPTPSILTIVVPGLLCALTFIPNGMPAKNTGKVAVAVWTRNDNSNNNTNSNSFRRSLSSPSTQEGKPTSAFDVVSPLSSYKVSHITSSGTNCAPTSTGVPNQW